MLDGRIILLIIFCISFIGMTSIIIDMLRVDEDKEKRVVNNVVKKPKESVVSEDFDFEVNSDLLEP